MLIEVKVPQLSESVSEATLVSWHKKEGDAVARDENLIDIETDKVVLELPAPSAGVGRQAAPARPAAVRVARPPAPPSTPGYAVAASPVRPGDRTTPGG